MRIFWFRTLVKKGSSFMARCPGEGHLPTAKDSNAGIVLQQHDNLTRLLFPEMFRVVLEVLPRHTRRQICVIPGSSTGGAHTFDGPAQAECVAEDIGSVCPLINFIIALPQPGMSAERLRVDGYGLIVTTPEKDCIAAGSLLSEGGTVIDVRPAATGWKLLLTLMTARQYLLPFAGARYRPLGLSI